VSFFAILRVKRQLQEEFDFEEERLSRAINELPLLRRRVLAMTFIEQLTAPEIAERLGCSANYVYKQKHRG
jgi:RNA polymerase sigma factor (sigma-70 family)